MIKDNIKIYKDLTALSEGFTRFLTDTVIKRNSQPNIALSGGSTPKVIFEYWSKNYSKALPWDRMKLFWGDERCVPPHDSMSNYGMTKDLLIDKVDILPNNIFRIHGESEPHEEAQWYSEVLTDHLPVENGIPVFDLVMLGLGDDGHTVSIFPDQIQLWYDDRLCIVTHHPESGMERVSITGKVINNARNVAFLVTGKSKAEKVKEIIQNRSDFEAKYPAALVTPASGEIVWFMDEAAASLL
ncbi:6-phosphogluconolactonase [Dysgonomonas sp. 216]|uniref:6-phosphogluconolactonase n=1 Tax=Dysgonomonas sp. 216 TaxID=2302934 RepID=UPI0013D274F9|nr:6-phosphogluconolactonase [Dysgonomonas sp. 216]NDW18619.1 6-phosphogluconolactonase [Dysgonomonas sp. 216]